MLDDLDPFALYLRDTPGASLRSLITNREAREIAATLGLRANNVNQLERALQQQVDALE